MIIIPVQKGAIRFRRRLFCRVAINRRLDIFAVGAKAAVTVTSKRLERGGKVTATNKDLWQILMSPLISLFLSTSNS